jgi:acyl carrier protein
VGLDDHFIEAGGHSLAALQILAGVEQAFGVEASLASLLEAGTIREMARVIAEHARRQPEDGADEPSPTERGS